MIFQNFISQQNSEVSSSKSLSEWRVEIKISNRHFFCPKKWRNEAASKDGVIFYCASLKGWRAASDSGTTMQGFLNSSSLKHISGPCLSYAWKARNFCHIQHITQGNLQAAKYRDKIIGKIWKKQSWCYFTEQTSNKIYKGYYVTISTRSGNFRLLAHTAFLHGRHTGKFS